MKPKKTAPQASKTNWPLLLAFILLCEFIGILGGLATQESIPTWYATLNKPIFTPPAWLFAPVWILLYALMGIAAYLVWKKGVKKPQVQFALLLFALQLILNLKWSLVFFGLHSIGGGLIVIVILDLLILATLLKFKPIDQKAAWLMVPYLLWCLFATLLNAALWLMN
ncbi:TspO/MBR family protein [uncultured archaeon]|nr:TspO/MBR family protein [uncultured archaeon]